MPFCTKKRRRKKLYLRVPKNQISTYFYLKKMSSWYHIVQVGEVNFGVVDSPYVINNKGFAPSRALGQSISVPDHTLLKKINHHRLYFKFTSTKPVLPVLHNIYNYIKNKHNTDCLKPNLFTLYQILFLTVCGYLPYGDT
jgi:hypothetical protein